MPSSVRRPLRDRFAIRLLRAWLRHRALPSPHAPGSVAWFDAQVAAAGRDVSWMMPAFVEVHAATPLSIALCLHASWALALCVREGHITEKDAHSLVRALAERDFAERIFSAMRQGRRVADG